jgi:hypothetical protein
MRLRDFLHSPYTPEQLDSEVTLTPVAIPVDCALSEWSQWAPTSEWSACVNGTQSRTERRTRTVVTPPSNGGAPCGPLEETRTVSQACTVPPPSNEIPVIHSASAKPIRFDAWDTGAGAYTRGEYLQVITQADPIVRAHANSTLSGTFNLLIDGVVNTSAQPNGIALAFTVNIATVADGWHLFGITQGGVEVAYPYYFFVNRAGRAVAPQDKIPVVTGSYTANGASGIHHAMVPGRFTPKPMPLTPRAATPFSDRKAPEAFYRTDLVPDKKGDIYRPNTNAQGVMSTFNRHSYYWDTLIGKIPSLPLLDGPRGVGKISMPTSIRLDRNGGAFCTDPWRVVRVSLDGTVRTRAGYRHKAPMYWQDGANNMELVGDWSGIPVERRGFHELWGQCWDVDSLSLDPNAPPQGGEQPHVSGPRQFVTDTQNNRVCLLTYSKDNRALDPVVTEFITGLQDPWGIAWHDSLLYVGERNSNRICAYDDQTGALVRVVVQGSNPWLRINPQIRVSDHRGLFPGDPCALPEHIEIFDGMLYYGSITMGAIKKIPLTGGTPELVTKVQTDQGAVYTYFSISDGTFGPRGAIFVVSWSIIHPFPAAYLPDGTTWGIGREGYLTSGRGGYWRPMDYKSAVVVGNGRMIAGSSKEGLVMFTLATPSDPMPNHAAYERGYRAWIAKGYQLVYGEDGYGYFDLPLPWGESADIDYYLSWNGHVRSVN